jgi:hypothetical protein
MNSKLLLRGALAVAALSSLAGPAAAADAAKRAPSTAMYTVTFRAEMTDRWQSREHYTDDCELTGQMCVRTEDGAGSARLNVKTKRPFRMMVMRGARGQGPAINVGTGEGAPVSGPYLRSGSLVTEYSGPWDAGNPDRKAEDRGCGRKTIEGDVNFTWRGRNQLGLSPILDVDRADCPTGPATGWEWDGGESPSLMDVIAQVSQNKFLRTKQFTVRGSKKWTGKVEPFSRSSSQGAYTKSGNREVTWQWEATFRMESAKKKRKRR